MRGGTTVLAHGAFVATAKQLAEVPDDLRGRELGAAWSESDTPFTIAADAEVWKAADDIDPKKSMRVGGLVSTESLDRDAEKVISAGLNFDECIKWGWFNDDHIKGTVVGVPEWAGYLRKGGKRPSGRPASRDGWYTEGYLLDTPRAKEIYETAIALQGTGRSLGYSIEGKILQKGNGLVQKAIVREIAITKKPVNTDTYMDLPTLAKAMEAGHENPPTGGTPGDGGPLRQQSLQGAGKKPPRSNVMDKLEQFEADREKKGMSKAEYAKALDKDDPEGAKLYNALCDADSAKKSLHDVSAQRDALAKSLDALANSNASLREQVAVNADELAKSVRDTGQGVDVAPFIAEISDQFATSAEGIVKALDTTGRATLAVGHLVSRMEKALADNNTEIADLKNQVADMAKSLSDLGASPVLRRGASNLQQAAALARNFGGKQADADGANVLKSLQGQWEQLACKGEKLTSFEKSRLDNIGHLITLAETGSADMAITKARQMGLLSA